MRGPQLLALAAYAALSLTLAAAPSFRFQRAVQPGVAGPNRLEVDGALLAGAARDLHDLRLFDAGGAEVSYLVMPPERGQPEWISGRSVPVAATKETSGFEIDLGRMTRIDRVRLGGLRPPFLKHVRLEGSGDRVRWVLLADASVFDVPEESLRLLEIGFEAETCRYLRFTWDDRSSALVTDVPDVSARLADSSAPAPPLRFAVPFTIRADEPGKTHIRVILPGSGLPVEALEIETAARDVFRPVSIGEVRSDRRRPTRVLLGTGVLQRTASAVTTMSIPIAAPRGRELELTIDDGANPALEIASVIAVLPAQPWMFFESRDGAPLVARYGDAKLARAVYDLEAKRDFVGRSNPVKAVWGNVRALAPQAPVTAPEEVRDRKRFWIVIAVIAVALLALLGRILRSGGGVISDE